MSIDSRLYAGWGQRSRRDFLQGLGAVGITLSSRKAWNSTIPARVREASLRRGTAITLLEDGGFQGTAWGWQFTDGAGLVEESRRNGHQSVHILTESGDYARFLVLEPEVGKTYTLSGWVKTQNVVSQDDSAGAYFAAGQFEFQGRPTVFSVDGKQIHDKRYGNYSGTSDWQRFSQTFSCLPGTTWFEVVVGIYRASGSAWFTDLTFVEGDLPAELENTVDYWQALEWVQQETATGEHRSKPAAAILRDTLPIRGVAADPNYLAKILGEIYDVSFLSAQDIADSKRLNRQAFDLLVLPYGETFPLAAKTTVFEFLSKGGNLLSMGGYAFQSPVISKGGQWEFYDDSAAVPNAENILPAFDVRDRGWTVSNTDTASSERVNLQGATQQLAAKISVPDRRWNQGGTWHCEVPVEADPSQYFFEAWIRTDDVRPAPDGCAYIEMIPLDGYGNQVAVTGFSSNIEMATVRGSHAWQKIERLVCMAPGCQRLKIVFGLRNATGSVWGAGFRLERRAPQVRMNTARGVPHDELVVAPEQIGVFDASFRLKLASVIRAADGQSLFSSSEQLNGNFQGYAATGVIGINQARWIPVLEAYDSLGRKRGAAGALIHHTRGTYARSSWSYFGVENTDIFAQGSKLGEETLRAVGKALANKIFLHACETDFASYRQGEAVRLRVLATNFGRTKVELQLNWSIQPDGGRGAIFEDVKMLSLEPGQTMRVHTEWHAPSFKADFYRATTVLMKHGEAVDRLETGFTVWSSETLSEGLDFKFKDNYFQVDGQSIFLQGTDDYIHTFVNQDENPLTWSADAEGCRDACITVYENLMGLRGPQQRPTKTWWRWIDGMLLSVQRSGGAFFPGMLIFSNASVSDRDLEDQKAYVRAFAARYKDANGLMYYLNGDFELHDPNLPNFQKLYNEFLQTKYGSDEALRQAWTLSPPEEPIGELKILPGKDDWRDVRTLDDREFRTQLVLRWLNAMHSSIREEDMRHPVTAEFYQSPVSGIDLLTALGPLELANFGYFNSPGEDFYGFPQACKLLDQRIRGKGINIGEFGVKTHPAWRDVPDYIAARSEEFEHAYFLAIAHYSFALGASKIQNWCWKYPSDLPFEWGINFPNELIARDVRAFYRNSGLLFRWLRPRYKASDVVLLVPGENRKGGQSARVFAGISNSIRLLIDQRIDFSVLADEFLHELPAAVKTIFYPLPYCASESTYVLLCDFVRKGGKLYLSGDICYDSLRRRTQKHRLTELCGVEFVRDRYANIAYDSGAQSVVGKVKDWPDYVAAPGIELRLAGAKTLVETSSGVPVVTEFELGAGRVIFSADPVEFHGDARFHAYAHSFYKALGAAFDLRREVLEPMDAPVHRFHVPSQDDRTITVLVNHNETQAVQGLVVPTATGNISLSLGAMLPGVIVTDKNGQICAVESSGDVQVDERKLITSDLHFMAIALDHRPLSETRALLLLPMNEGSMRISHAQRWQKPVVLTGGISGGRWRQNESFTPNEEAGMLHLPISALRAFSVVVLCEGTEQDQVIKRLELLINEPWLSVN